MSSRAPLSTDYKSNKVTKSSSDARAQWFGNNNGGSSQYPNWTMGAESGAISAKPTVVCAPTTLQTIPNVLGHNKHSPGRGRPSSTICVKDIEGASPRHAKARMSASTSNWTVPIDSPRLYHQRPQFVNTNIDIEGSRPALTRFKKCNQRIVPDPYPERASRYRAQQTHHATKFTENGFVGSAALTPRTRAERAEHPNVLGEASGGVDKGSLQLKKIEFFRNGHYVTQSVVMDNSGPPHTVGLATSKGTRTDDIQMAGPRSRTPPARVDPNNGASPARATTPRGSLRTDDIEGARNVGGRRMFVKPDLRLDVTNINTTTTRTTVSPRNETKKNYSLTTADIPGAKASPRVSPTASRKTLSMSLQTNDIAGAAPKVRQPPATTGWW